MHLSDYSTATWLALKQCSKHYVGHTCSGAQWTIMSCDFIGVCMCVDVACADKIYHYWSSRRLGHVALLDSRSATCGRIKVTASVTDPLYMLYSTLSSLHSIQSTQNQEKNQLLSSTCCWNCRGEREEIEQVKNLCMRALRRFFFSAEAACNSWGSNSMHERHGGETDAQRQDMLATSSWGNSSRGTTNKGLFTIEFAFTLCTSNVNWIHINSIHTAKIMKPSELLLVCHTHCSPSSNFYPWFIEPSF